MQGRETYEYAVIRLVPKVEREEFINVGVILFSKRKKFLGIKYKVDEERILAFSKDTDVDMIQKYLAAWELICDGSPKGGKIAEFELSLRFRWLVACRSTIIQSSKTHPGLSDDPEAVLVDLFERYVM
jgi:hypothetical protein